MLLLLHLLLRRAVLALELEMLPDRIVENAHRAQAYGTGSTPVHRRPGDADTMGLRPPGGISGL